MLTKGQLLEKIAGVDDSVPVTVHHNPATGVQLARNEAGDLAIDIVLDPPAVATPDLPAEPPAEVPAIDEADKLEQLTERRKNDPSSLTEEESAELARLEKLAGVEERRTGEGTDTGTPSAVDETEPHKATEDEIL